MTSLSIEPLSEKILLDIFHQSLRNAGLIDAVSYRAEHDDWLERLNELEQRRLLKRDGDGYRVTFVVLTLLKDNEIVIERNRCESVFDILRGHYKNPDTRNQEKRLQELSEDLKLSYEQIVQTIRYFMDASTLWLGGSTTTFKDPGSAYIRPSESIITCKCFDDLVAKVHSWYRPHTFESASTLEILPSLPAYDSPRLQQARSDLHPGPIVTSYLCSMKSDAVVSIVGRVGLIVDWSLTKSQSYSERTRLRAYIPRIEGALQSLDESDRMLVARNVARELVHEAPETLEPLSKALEKIGWQIVDGEITTLDFNSREAFFPSGAEHTAYVEIRRILGGARRCIDIIDPYLDGSIFAMLKALPSDATDVRFLTASPPSDFKLEASKFQKEALKFRIEIRINRDFHDRFIVLDGEQCFHLGASIKDAGKRAFMISQLEDRANVVSLVNFTKEKWEQATPL